MLMVERGFPTFEKQRTNPFMQENMVYGVKQHTGSTACSSCGFSVCTYTLVELSVPAEGHAGLVPTVHSVNVVPLDLLDLVHGHIACKWDLQPHCQGEQTGKNIVANIMALQLSTYFSW